VQVSRKFSVEGQEGLGKVKCQVIAGHEVEYALLIGALEVEAARSIAPDVDSCQQCDLGPKAVDVARIAPGPRYETHSAE